MSQLRRWLGMEFDIREMIGDGQTLISAQHPLVPDTQMQPETDCSDPG